MTTTNYKSQVGAAAQYLLNEEWLRQHYEVMRLSTRKIAELAGCGKKAVISALRRFGINIAPSGTNRNIGALTARSKKTHMRSELVGKIDDRDWLYDQFIVQDKSHRQISEEFKVSTYCIRRWLKRHKITKEKRQWVNCSFKRYLENNGFAPGSEEACKKRMRGRRGRSINTLKGGTIWCHSSWEALVSQVLDSHINVSSYLKDYLKLPYEFNNKRHFYFVDFVVKLVDGRILTIEVKASRLINEERTAIKLKILSEYATKMGYEIVTVTGTNKPKIDRLLAIL